LPVAEWALDGSTGGSGGAKIISPLGTHKRRDGSGYNLADHYRACAEHTAEMVASVEPLIETGFVGGAEVIAVAFGTPGKYVRAAVRAMRADRLPVGYVRPITLFPFPTAALAEAVEGARAVAVYENNQGQMIEDVRLAVMGKAPVHFIGGLSLDSSGFGIAPDLDVGVIRSRLEGLLA
jgi:2-oxoglutarate ferredoxin oxidoreductase subunit alpha